jgi:APA family basic amino acid/polyamine antiporter
MRAGAIVLPMARGSTGFARALETVLRERPCRVIIESTPEAPARRTPVAA